MDVYATELGIRVIFGKTSEFGGLNTLNTPSVRHCLQATLQRAASFRLTLNWSFADWKANEYCDSGAQVLIVCYGKTVLLR
jgi:hypothetical protein